MPDKRHHRGPHPEDAALFAAAQWAALRAAVAQLSWLLSRGYATPSALKLVGDRHALNQRQRTAVMRCACSDESLRSRLARRVNPDQISGRIVHIDGYNVLTSVEAALGGGVIIVGRDSCWRDMASMHGSFRKVEETPPALLLIGQSLVSSAVGRCVWYLDQPVSNSGRLAELMRKTAAESGFDWQVQIVPNPDAVLIESGQIVASADSVVLDGCGAWLNLARQVIHQRIEQANVVDLSAETKGSG